MIVFDKHQIRESITLEDIYTLLHEWGGEPEYTPFGILCATICHNPPGEGSKKLYFYNNTGLFHCYTDCGSFDIFELVIKIASLQWHKTIDLNSAVRWIALRFGLSGMIADDIDPDELEDWKHLANYARIQDIEYNNDDVVLKEYDSDILTRFNYKVKIAPWLNEGINQQSLSLSSIGFYPGGDQITIPHFDKDGRFIGLRGRCLCAEEGELYGKYRPLKINGLLYNHPLGMNLYNFNHSKKNIAIFKKAIIFEAEKSTLLYKSYFGEENDISVACCGSNVSAFQMKQLIDAGAQEIIIAFDRQFQEIGDAEFRKLTSNLTKLHDKYKRDVIISFIFDKKMITGYKDSPIDRGPEVFLQLFKERIILN